jgi:hypothetical protein
VSWILEVSIFDHLMRLILTFSSQHYNQNLSNAFSIVDTLPCYSPHLHCFSPHHRVARYRFASSPRPHPTLLHRQLHELPHQSLRVRQLCRPQQLLLAQLRQLLGNILLLLRRGVQPGDEPMRPYLPLPVYLCCLQDLRCR